MYFKLLIATFLFKIMFNFVISIVPADGPALLGIRTSAATMTIK